MPRRASAWYRVAQFYLPRCLFLLWRPRVGHSHKPACTRGSSDNPNGPTVSPYLNLLQNNNQLNVAPNYQSLVKPLIDQRNATQRQGNALQNLQQKVNAQGAGGAGVGRGTGLHTTFMNYSHFYPAPKAR